MKNALIIILVIGLLVLGFLFFKEKSSRDTNINEWPETVSATPTNNNYQPNSIPVGDTPYEIDNENSYPASQQGGQNQITWIKAGESQLYYPSGFSVEEHYTLNPGQSSSDPEASGVLEFRATRGNAIISWGGFNYECTENEYGAFIYGTSQIACLDGVRTQLGVVNVRGVLTQEDRNSFGDFVLKNQ